MTPQEPVRIARIGLVLEMVDGSKVMVYSDDLPGAEALIKTEGPEWEPGDPWRPRRPLTPLRTSITITGLESYRIQYAEPGCKVSAPGRALETIRREVRP
jgi:hypothetical protein